MPNTKYNNPPSPRSPSTPRLSSAVPFGCLLDRSGFAVCHAQAGHAQRKGLGSFCSGTRARVRARDLKALPSTPLLHGLEAYTAPWERRKRALSAPAFRSSFTHSASPRNAAKWSGARPRLFGRGFEGGGRLGGPPFRRELRSGKDPKNGRRSRCPKPRRAHNCSAVHFLLGFLCSETCVRRHRCPYHTP